ncbi:RIP metalloprotease RseP [Candidatus Roizmanbacteria bacterium]|nr:RIP metalloprotease RseP [Candidatus Roizmanbacteria bacterium]
MIINIAVALLLLSILVFVHELGHFLSAKLMRIRVEEFGLGLPPRWIGRKIGETIYSLNKLPIGGFVRLYGEDEPDPTHIKKDRDRAFFAISPWKRAVILVAGVSMNVIFAWFAYTVIFTLGDFVPVERVHIEEINSGSPAEAKGLQKGDIIKEIRTLPDNESFPILAPEKLSEVARANLGKDIVLVIERSGESQEIVVAPRTDPPPNEGPLGVVISNLEEKKLPLIEASVQAAQYIGELVKLIVEGMGMLIAKLIARESVRNDVAGPVEVVRQTALAVEYGFRAVLRLAAFISVNLAIINILPIPALDGGRLLFVVIEGITGKRINQRWESYLHQVGMLLLLFLILLITVNDILRLVTG